MSYKITKIKTYCKYFNSRSRRYKIYYYNDECYISSINDLLFPYILIIQKI